MTQRGLRSSEPCGGRRCRYKKRVPPHQNTCSLYLSTVQMSYLVTLITKAIDTTSNSYLYLYGYTAGGETYPGFFYKKTRLF